MYSKTSTSVWPTIWLWRLKSLTKSKNEKLCFKCRHQFINDYQGSISSSCFTQLWHSQIPKPQKPAALTVFFALFGSALVRAAFKMLVKLVPDWKGKLILNNIVTTKNNKYLFNILFLTQKTPKYFHQKTLGNQRLVKKKGVI